MELFQFLVPWPRLITIVVPTNAHTFSQLITNERQHGAPTFPSAKSEDSLPFLLAWRVPGWFFQRPADEIERRRSSEEVACKLFTATTCDEESHLYIREASRPGKPYNCGTGGNTCWHWGNVAGAHSYLGTWPGDNIAAVKDREEAPSPARNWPRASHPRYTPP